MPSCEPWSTPSAPCLSERTPAPAGEGPRAGARARCELAPRRPASARRSAGPGRGVALRRQWRRLARGARRWPVEPQIVPGQLPWRPSHVLAACLWALGLGAALSLLASECPPAVAWPAAVAALAWARHSARCELRRPARRLDHGGRGLRLDGRAMSVQGLHRRGWLLRLDLRGEDGRRERLLWWPDTLGAHGRRELRLAAAVGACARRPRSMAP